MEEEGRDRPCRCGFGSCWPKGMSLPGNRFSMFCTCYFVALMTDLFSNRANVSKLRA